MTRGLTLNLMASALTICAAIALLGSAALVGDASDIVPDARGDSTTVQRFYAVLNDVLRGGDLALLDEVVTPRFQMHAHAETDVLDREGLGQKLQTMRVIDPAFQLAVLQSSSAGHLAIAQVGTTAHGADAVLGLDISPPLELWGTFDLLRVDEGRIAELWSSGESTAWIEPLRQTRATTPRDTEWNLALERLVAPPDMPWESGRLSFSRLISVDTGTLIVAIDRVSFESASLITDQGWQLGTSDLAPGARATLRAGDAIFLPEGSQYHLQRAGASDVLQVTSIAFSRYRYTGPLPSGRLTHLTADDLGDESLQVLAATPVVMPGRQSLTVSFGRVMVQPGSALSVRAEAGPLLLAVDEGNLDLTSFMPGAPNPAQPSTISLVGNAEVLGSGEAAIVASGMTAELRAVNREPVIALAITLLPEAARSEVRS